MRTKPILARLQAASMGDADADGGELGAGELTTEAVAGGTNAGTSDARLESEEEEVLLTECRCR